MVRAISSNSLAKLATRQGTEPINIIEIQWVAGGGRCAYADRAIAGGVQGRILEVSDLDDVMQVTGAGSARSSSSAQVHVLLDDTDGSIKAILDTHDIHKRPCWVYQWFEGLDLNEKFLIFKGEINTPIEWREGDRTVGFDVIQKIEDVEVGFSMEEGEFYNIPKELVGKPWPLCFGTVVNVPAFRSRSFLQGTLATGMGIVDPTLKARLDFKLICPVEWKGWRIVRLPSAYGEGYGGLEFQPVYGPVQSCLEANCATKEKLRIAYEEQLAYELPTCTIWGGDKFPQGVNVALNIGGGHFTGYFEGELFHIIGRRHPQIDEHGKLILPPAANEIQSKCGSGRPPDEELLGGSGTVQPGSAQDLGGVLASQKAAQANQDAFNKLPTSNFFWANPGAKVTIDSSQEIIYIANLLPSTVLRVAAKRTLPGSPTPQLMTVPSSYYTVRQVDYRGNVEHPGYTGVTEIVFDRPLSYRMLNDGTANSEGWSDDVYVTLTSSVGPNTVDVLRWFIEMYTQYGVDDTSFAAVRTLIDNYPSHFALLTRKNIQTVLQEIAYQARCALWLKDDKFYIKYLSLEPEIDETITVSDIEASSLVLTHTPTEDLITKYVATWIEDYAATEPNQLILRHNVAKYGLHEQTFDYYIYNIQSLVRKSATFWLIRKANTWRKVQCKTPLSKLKLEVFDTVGLTLHDVADNQIKAVVEKANYNSENNSIDFELWTPLRSGSREPYDFAFPADISEKLVFPTLDDTLRGYAGSGTEPNFSTVAPSGHGLDSSKYGLWQNINMGDPNNAQEIATAGDKFRSDHGASKPSDRGDSKPSPNAHSDSGGGGGSGAPAVSGSGGTSCCDNAASLAKQALDTANRALQQSSKTASNQSGEKRDPADDLPETCGGNCTVTVTLQYGIVSQVVANGWPSSEPGATGPINNMSWDGRRECYTFNSMTAAQAFAKSKRAQSFVGGVSGTVGQEAIKDVFGPGPNLGMDTDQKSLNYGNPCLEPSPDKQAMVGKKKNA